MVTLAIKGAMDGLCRGTLNDRGSLSGDTTCAGGNIFPVGYVVGPFRRIFEIRVQ
jgi:hypothetical protein